MKKKNKKKLPGYWLGTRKPTSLGYQPNYGIGNAQFTSVEGEDLTPEANAARRNIIPSALGKISQQGMFAANMLQHGSSIAGAALQQGARAALHRAGQSVAQVAPDVAVSATPGAFKAAEAVGGERESARKAGAAIELIHTFSLMNYLKDVLRELLQQHLHQMYTEFNRL